MDSKHNLMIFYLLIFLIIFSTSMIINPNKLNEGVVINDYIFSLKSEKIIVQDGNIELNVIKNIQKINYKSQPFFLNQEYFICKNENNNTFLLMENKYYRINIDSESNEIESLTLIKTLSDEEKYLGCIQEKGYNETTTSHGSKASIVGDEIIIYWKKFNNDDNKSK